MKWPQNESTYNGMAIRIVNAITDLRTKLAAQGWQPVTEPPEGVLRGFLYDPHVQYFGGDYSIYSPKEGWMHKHRITPTHWRPLPPPPTGGDS